MILVGVAIGLNGRLHGRFIGFPALFLEVGPTHTDNDIGGLRSGNCSGGQKCANQKNVYLTHRGVSSVGHGLYSSRPCRFTSLKARFPPGGGNAGDV